MERAFPDALVRGSEGIIKGISGLPHQNDRHMVAAAILGKAAAIVTANTKHFPHAVLEPLGLEQIAPDQFLLDQWRLDPEELMDRIEDQAAAIS
jgi:hypothetical protein